MAYVLSLIDQYGLLAIFLVIALEYACFPLPSEVVLPLAGALAAQGGMSLFSIYGVSILAGLLGSTVCYGLGRWGGVHLLEKFMLKFPKSRKGLEGSQQQFSRYAHWAVCLGRMIPLCRTYISLIAGVSKQNLVSFLLFSFLGIACWNGILVGGGYFLGENWQLIEGYYEQFKGIIIVLALSLAGIVAIYWFKFAKKG